VIYSSPSFEWLAATSDEDIRRSMANMLAGYVKRRLIGYQIKVLHTSITSKTKKLEIKF